MKEILDEAKLIEQEIIRDRRYIHMNPEVGFDLPNTSLYVKEQLKSMGIEPSDCGIIDEKNANKFKSVGFNSVERSTGVTATIGKGRPCILLRADMDALPMAETTNLEFKSMKQASHMCGHDAHTAMLLGAARILKARENELNGSVKLMFQPGEELGYGSRTMIDDGLLNGVDAALALHVMSDQDAGTVEYIKGITSAAMDTFMLKVKGKGRHSSMPQQSIDPNMIVNQIYTALNLLPGREISPKETVALTAGRISGGTAANIIPDTADMQIGCRTFNVDVRNHLSRRIPEMIDHYVKAWRGEYDLTVFSTPSTYTDENLCDELLPFIKEMTEENKVVENKQPMSGTEDFSYVSDKVPSVFLKIGAGSPSSYPMHNPNMVIDESVFVQGTAIMANCAMEFLRNKGAE